MCCPRCLPLGISSPGSWDHLQFSRLQSQALRVGLPPLFEWE